jgi:hypothetical protein
MGSARNSGEESPTGNKRGRGLVVSRGTDGARD